MPLIDKSTKNEKQSPFYQKNWEVVQLWKNLAKEIEGDITGSFNSYMVELEIKSEVNKVKISGLRQQYTAQSDTTYPENSHYSEFTKIKFSLDNPIDFFKVSKSSFYEKLMRKISRNRNQIIQIEPDFEFESDSTAILNQADLLDDFRSLINLGNLKSINQDPKRKELRFQFSKLFLNLDRFKTIFDLADRLKITTDVNKGDY